MGVCRGLPTGLQRVGRGLTRIGRGFDADCRELAKDLPQVGHGLVGSQKLVSKLHVPACMKPMSRDILTDREVHVPTLESNEDEL